MTIETKYNIGDEVWFTTHGRCEKAKIAAFRVIGFADGSVQIEYLISKSGFYWSRCESQLFPEVTFENSPQQVEIKLVK